MHKLNKDEKIHAILSATIQLLAENDTIIVALLILRVVPKFTKACCIIITSKTKKEDLVSKALASCSNTMIQAGKEALSASKSTDELLEGAVSFFKRDMEHSPDFFGLIFETRCTVRRSKRIKKNSMLELARDRLTLRKS